MNVQEKHYRKVRFNIFALFIYIGMGTITE